MDRVGPPPGSVPSHKTTLTCQKMFIYTHNINIYIYIYIDTHTHTHTHTQKKTNLF